MPHAGAWIGYIALGSAALAALLIIYFLVKKPPLDLRVKLILLLGLGVFPAITAATSTVAGMEQTTHREFCGSCHVMGDHLADATDPRSQSLAARHTRIPFFGEESCYVCHADYGMYGYALTKAGGMRHVYLYYLGGYDHMSMDEARRKIHLAKPYDNLNCRQCHSTTARVWTEVPDHRSLEHELETNRVSCASAGCHGFAHPFTKGPDGLGLVPSASSSATTAGGAAR
ncbi:MAG TPA: NapC/NirT family cytochrome c [Polyangiaceae bacterium]|nr:NapC/NirT family cytochrome c [Polyangiaceae bacterium]